MEMKRVFSSHIDSVGYEDEQLVVKFQNGRTCVYQGVPQDVANLVVNAPSVGTALNQYIKDRYPFAYVPAS